MLYLLKGEQSVVRVVFQDGEVKRAFRYDSGALVLTSNLTYGAVVDRVDTKSLGWTAREDTYTHAIPIVGNQLVVDEDDFELEWVSKFVDPREVPTHPGWAALTGLDGVTYLVTPEGEQQFSFLVPGQEAEIRHGTLAQVLGGKPASEEATEQEPEELPAQPEPKEGDKEEVENTSQAVYTIETTHFQEWRTVALLSGLGFSHRRDFEENVDVFTSMYPVKCVYDGWTPSRDDSRLTSFEQLRDPGSVHFGRHYVTAYKFTHPNGRECVIAWHSSSSSSGQLFGVIGLDSLQSWEAMRADGSYEAWKQWFTAAPLPEYGSEERPEELESPYLGQSGGWNTPVMYTDYAQPWQRKTLLAGLGFGKYRPDTNIWVFHSSFGDVVGVFDDFVHLEEGWVRLVTFKFTSPTGYDNVVVWRGSATDSERLLTIVGLGSYAEWQQMVTRENEGFGWSHWLRYNRPPLN